MDIANAIETIYRANATPDERRIAQEVCETAKNLPTAPLAGHHLSHISNNYSDNIRFFGLQMILHSIKTFPSSQAEQTQIKDLVLDLCANGIRDISTEPIFIKEKCVRLCVEIAERMWPLTWTDFNSFLKIEWTRSVFLF